MFDLESAANAFADWLDADGANCGARLITLRELQALPFFAGAHAHLIEDLLTQAGFVRTGGDCGSNAAPAVYAPCEVCPKACARKPYTRFAPCCLVVQPKPAASHEDLAAYVRLYGKAQAPDAPGAWIWLFQPHDGCTTQEPFVRIRFAHEDAEGVLWFMWPHKERPGMYRADTEWPAHAFQLQGGQWYCAPVPLNGLRLPPGYAG